MSDTEGQPQAPQQDRLDALFAEIGNLREENKALKQDVLKLALQPTPHYEPKSEPGGPDLDGLPDFNLDPEAHLRERDRRIAAYAIERAQEVTGTKDATSRREEALWKKFQEAYPDISKDPEKVEFAVRKARDEADAKGYDLQKYIYGHAELFFEDVEKHFKKIFGPGGEKSVEKAKQEHEGMDEDEAQVYGIFGGGESRGKGAPEEPEEKLGSLTGDLKEMQRKSGLAW